MPAIANLIQRAPTGADSLVIDDGVVTERTSIDELTKFQGSGDAAAQLKFYAYNPLPAAIDVVVLPNGQLSVEQILVDDPARPLTPTQINLPDLAAAGIQGTREIEILLATRFTVASANTMFSINANPAYGNYINAYWTSYNIVPPIAAYNVYKYILRLNGKNKLVSI